MGTVRRSNTMRLLFRSNLFPTQTSQARQPYLNKCFDGIDRLEFGTQDGDGMYVKHNEIAIPF